MVRLGVVCWLDRQSNLYYLPQWQSKKTSNCSLLGCPNPPETFNCSQSPVALFCPNYCDFTGSISIAAENLPGTFLSAHMGYQTHPPMYFSDGNCLGTVINISIGINTFI